MHGYQSRFAVLQMITIVLLQRCYEDGTNEYVDQRKYVQSTILNFGGEIWMFQMRIDTAFR